MIFPIFNNRRERRRKREGKSNEEKKRKKKDTSAGQHVNYNNERWKRREVREKVLLKQSKNKSESKGRKIVTVMS